MLNFNITDVYETLIANFSSKDDPAEYQIDFEQFCAVAAEWAWKLKNNSVASESEIPSIWSILYKKASKFIHRAFIHPFNKFIGIFIIKQFSDNWYYLILYYILILQLQILFIFNNNTFINPI